MAGTLEAASAIDYPAHAARLRHAYAGPPLAPLRDELPGATLEDAYAIQAANTTYWLGEGRKRTGAKIGLTSKAVQVQLGVDQPDFGTLFADMEIADGGTVPSGRLLQPKVEAEIAFCLARRLEEVPRDLAELAAAVAYAVPSIEIVDSRIANWNIGIVDTIADNASSGLYVLGATPTLVRDLDLKLCGMVLERSGNVVSLGAGAACLGNPLYALGWLAQTMADLGNPLEEGDIVLAGALGPMVAVEPGDSFIASIAGLGSVTVGFAS